MKIPGGRKAKAILVIDPTGSQDLMDEAYSKKMMEAMSGAEPGLSFVQIRHDDWCPKLKTPAGTCRCDPDVIIEKFDPDARS